MTLTPASAGCTSFHPEILMTITNAIIYRVTIDPALHTAALIDEALQKLPFVECSPSQEKSVGWVPPRGEAHGPMLESVGGQWIARLMTETRSVPASAVKRAVEQRAKQIEETTGRKPGRKETKELKVDAVHALLPMAFPKLSSVTVWIDPTKGLLVLDTSSVSRADSVVTELVKALEGFAVSPINTAITPSSAMAGWLSSQEPPQGFSVDREVELRSTDESKAVVRYAKHPLDIEEVQKHIADGKRPTRLALTWDDRVSFELTEGMTIRKIVYLEGTGDGAAGGKKEDNFDADVVIATGELSGLVAALFDSLGGEVQAGTGSSQPDAAGANPAAADQDDLYDKAVLVVRGNASASISLIQRHLQIGYNRAARLLDAMEARRVVSSMTGNGTRQVLEAV